MKQPGHTHTDLTTALQTLAEFDGNLLDEIRNNDDLRRQALSSIQKLVPELETPTDTAQRMLYSELEICAARIGVDLDIFGILSNSTEALTTDELARRTGIDPNTHLLARILRYMASIGMVREVGPGLWAQKNYGSNLIDKRQSAGVCHAHDNVLPAYVALPEFLRKNRYQLPVSKTDTSFALGHGSDPTTFFDWLQTHPMNARYFHEFMAVHRTGDHTWLDDKKAAATVIDHFQKQDSSDAILFVDIGGGLGHQCKLLQSRYPQLQGRVVLEDLPEVIVKVNPDETSFEKIGMNFFDSQPLKGAAAYYLRSIFRDWPDESCEIILGHIRDAMQPNSILLIDDLVLPDFQAHKFETQLDLTMLSMLNGQARTRGDWEVLLGQSGLVISDIIMYEEDAREAIIIARKCD
ncbi:S-adenosyl-L-methionine-dependent methyltransferase [Nemania sp. FL0916]|nr:S-adenosyl-L-methionine-dependent methyltransferase [Nemania sp. FL0916]